MFANLRLRSKLLSVFAVLLLVTGAFGLFALERMNLINAMSTEIAESWLPSVRLMGEVNSEMKEYRIQLAIHILNTDPAEMANIETKLEAIRTAIKGKFKEYEKFISSDEERALYTTLVQRWSKFLETAQTTIDYSRNNSTEQARESFAGPAREAKRAVTDTLNQIIKLNNTGAEEASTRGDVLYDDSRTVTLLFIGFFTAILGAALIVLLKGVARPINAMTGAMRELASGNLEIEITGKERRDEVGQMAHAVDVFKQNAIRNREMEEEQKRQEIRSREEKRLAMHQLAEHFENNVQGIINAVAAASTELLQTADQLGSVISNASETAEAANNSAAEATANVQSVASAAEEMATSVQEISMQIVRSNTMVSASREKTELADRQAEQLSHATKKVEEVIQLIADIAGQINLLALNATIESARAGEAGKGFAVVASEVKNLATQTNKSVEEISRVIREMQIAAADIIESLKGIQTSIIQITDTSTSIASAVEEQSATTNEIARNMQSAAQRTQKISDSLYTVSTSSTSANAASDQVRIASKELSERAEQLNRQVNSFLSDLRAA
jgi:methyl-accepting chemotaxis protein